MSDFKVNEYLKKLNINDEFFISLIDLIKRGDNVLSQSRLAESMVVDDSWIKTLEGYLHSVEQVAKKPKMFIKEDGIIVPVEKAKRTTSETIRHLSSHSNLIRSIDEYGNIIPSKVLTKEINEDIAIYENRFVNTLIIRLLGFIEQRYVAISKQVDGFDTTSLSMNSKFDLSHTNIEYDLKLKIRNRAKTNITHEMNTKLLLKLEEIRKRVLVIKSSAFCLSLANIKPVQSPIMKTNILKMDVNYKNCYNLWLFISSFTSIGFSVEMAEKQMPVDSDYYDDLTTLVALSLKTMLENNAINESKYRSIKYKKLSTKKFKVVRNSEVQTAYDNVKLTDDDSLINQFYYDKLKSLIIKNENSKKEKIIENNYKTNIQFRKFFKDLNKLNNEMYNEMLKVTAFDDVNVDVDSLKKKENAVKKQEELYKRYKLLTKLKILDLDGILKRESEQLIKLEKAKFELSQLKAKKTKRKPRIISEKSLENLKNRKPDLIESATLREIQMLSNERTRQHQQLTKVQEKTYSNRRKRQNKKNIDIDENK